MLSMCCCGRHVCPARAVATEACSLQPAARRRYRMHHLLGNDPGRAANQRKWVCRHALEYTQLWSFNAQQAVPVIVMRAGLRCRTHALSRQEQEVSVMRSWKPRLRFLRFLSPLLLVFLLPAGWGGRAPSAVRAADGARVLASEGMGTSGIGTLPPRPTITGHPPMMPTPCPTGMGHCPQEGVAPAQLVENGQYSDERFIDMMVPHHLMAIQMAQVAERYAEHPERSSSWPRRSSRRRGKRSTSSRPSSNASMAPPRPRR